MSIQPPFLWLVLLWLVSTAVASDIHGQRGRNAGIGALIGALFGPLGLLYVMLREPHLENIEADQIRRKERIICPHCVELIRPEVDVCRYCGRDVTVTVP